MTQMTVLAILLLVCIGGIATALLWLRDLATKVQRLSEDLHRVIVALREAQGVIAELRATGGPLPPQDDDAADRDQLWDASSRPAPRISRPTKLRTP